ncbi:hypothetical protein SAMN02746065_10427 [Desulfocicer vacuolatum DSM 3385]|uniref:Uncharacterized protein n=1 Tax=Desulfocicer vacuolatum DSM 3385 TaxID=1121400 RepID=A0A1W2A1N0_9BACT|nr:hypothetical protein [Desulfocicer vacuolatum]SMC54585.1 hypothetical protein SAMN02746065_10427 [Desulfocicer vacuolatum DSM 3385]
MTFKQWIIIMTLCLLQAPFCSANDAYHTLEAHLKQTKADNIFIPPSPEELQQVESLFYRLLKGERGKQMGQEWEKLHFSISETAYAGKIFLLVMEAPGHGSGRGGYIFPGHTRSNRVLMIPHGFHDHFTGQIGIRLSLEGNFAATLFNSVHRYGNRKKNKTAANKQKNSENSSPERQENWDMAARPDTFFTAFTKAFIRAFPRGSLIQLHGFAAKKRKTGQGRESDMIISAGTRYTSARAQACRECLQQKLSGNIRLYPDDVQELGGTRNIIGRTLRAAGHKGFIHIEMNHSMRGKIANEPHTRGLFSTCLTKF